MPSSTTADEVFDREFLPVRAKLLEVAASLDRIDRAEGVASDQGRRDQISEAIQTLLIPGTDRAERLQQIFSLPYDQAWRKFFEV